MLGPAGHVQGVYQIKSSMTIIDLNKFEMIASFILLTVHNYIWKRFCWVLILKQSFNQQMSIHSFRMTQLA